MSNHRVKFSVIKKTPGTTRTLLDSSNHTNKINRSLIVYTCDGIADLARLINHIKTRSVTTLKINHHDKTVTDTDVGNLGELFDYTPTVKSIYLFNFEINPTASHAIYQSISLGKNTNLSKIVFNNCSLNHDQVLLIMKGIDENSQIKELAIVNNYLPENVVKTITDYLSDNTTLLRLSLCSNMIDNAGSEHISKLLRTNETITEISVCSNLINDRGMAELTGSFGVNKSLTIVELSLNPFTQESILTLADHIDSNFNIQHVNMFGVKMTPFYYQQLVAKLSNNFVLKSFNINPINDRLFPHGNPEITEIIDRNKINYANKLANERSRRIRSAVNYNCY